MGDDKDASDTIEHAPIAGPLGKRRKSSFSYSNVAHRAPMIIVCGTKVDVFNMFILCMSMI